MKPGGEPISLPIHTASNPSTEKVLTVEMPHQRLDQVCPDDNVALHIKDLDKNNMRETHTHAGRLDRGVVKPGEDVVSLPTHTASNPSTEEVFTVETPQQRPDRASPGGKVPLATEGSGKYTPGSGDETLHQQIDQARPIDRECAVNDTSKQCVELRTVELDQGYDQIRLPSIATAATVADCADGPLRAALEKVLRSHIAPWPGMTWAESCELASEARLINRAILKGDLIYAGFMS